MLRHPRAFGISGRFRAFGARSFPWGVILAPRTGECAPNPGRVARGAAPHPAAGSDVRASAFVFSDGLDRRAREMTTAAATMSPAPRT